MKYLWIAVAIASLAILTPILSTEAAIAQARASNVSFPLESSQFERISSPYGQRIHPITGAKSMHSGIDIAAGQDDATILAWAEGQVLDVVTQDNGGCGLEVWVGHAKGWDSRYCHLSKVLVKRGDRVSAGQPVGRMGSTGSSTAPHLHFEVRLQEHLIDPMRVFNAMRRDA